MEKAFDTLSWNFIEAVMTSMDFEENWTFLIKQCISTVSYQVITNIGAPSESFKPIRGLRQVDPNSPYLFILFQNMFSLMLTREEEKMKIQGIKVFRGSIPISHLLFADDSYMFFRMNGQAYKTVKGVIEKYANLSGLNINKQNSELFVSPSCRIQRRRWFKGILGVNIVDNPSKYLRVELGLLNSRKRFFESTMERIKNKIKGWKGKLLSQVGKLTLINSTLAGTHLTVILLQGT